MEQKQDCLVENASLIGVLDNSFKMFKADNGIQSETTQDTAQKKSNC